jgi:hypothetical protein
VRRHAAAVLIAFAVATSAIGLAPSLVSAECPYLPPWPEITKAIPTAREIVVGVIVTDFDQADLHLGTGQAARDYVLRITHVLRGRAQPGDLLDVQYLQPNWPQIRFFGSTGPTPSCTQLRAAPGEVIALAFEALQPGGPMKQLDYEWVQPLTRYNAVGVIRGPGGDYGTNQYRERVTLRQLRHLASLPQTDTSGPVAPKSGGTSLLLVAGLIGLGLGMQRFRALSGRGRRVASGAVRRRER